MKPIIVDELILYIKTHELPSIRVNTEYKPFGLYVSRGKRGNSVIVEKQYFQAFCEENNYDLNNFISLGHVSVYSRKDFVECRHAKNVWKEEQKIRSEKRRVSQRAAILNDKSSTDDEKKQVRLEIWSEKILKNKGVHTSSHEDILYNKLYRRYRKRVKRQKCFILNKKVYFVDIYMKAYKAAIEVDGGYHNTPTQKEKDNIRDNALSSLGIVTIRIKNEDIKRKYKSLIDYLDRRHKEIINGIEYNVGTLNL